MGASPIDCSAPSTSRAKPVASNQLSAARGPPVVEQGQRIEVEDGGHPSAAGIPAIAGAAQHRPAIAPDQAVGAGEVVGDHPVLLSGLSERVVAGPHLPARPAAHDHRILDPPATAARKHHRAPPVRQVARMSRVERFDPPVLGGLRGTAQIQPPAMAGRHDHRPLERRSPEVVAEHLAHRLELHSVIRSGHHDAHPAALVQRTAYPVGEPEDTVDQHATGRPRPVARSLRRCRYDDVGVVEARSAEVEEGGHGRNPRRKLGFTIVISLTQIR